MSIRGKLFALSYDRQMARAEQAGLGAMRERLLTGAAGDVLEIGSGTGANLACYGPAVTSLTLTEPEPAMLRRLRRAVSQHAPAARVLRAPAEDLPFENDSFDTVVCTLVLCGVDDQPRALRELRRVLRPGGQLLFLEHLRSPDARTARMQDRMNWLNRLVVCCDCNRPTLETMGQAGFTITRAEPTAMPKAPPFVRPAVIGRASPQAAGGDTPSRSDSSNAAAGHDQVADRQQRREGPDPRGHDLEQQAVVDPVAGVRRQANLRHPRPDGAGCGAHRDAPGLRPPQG